MDKIAQEKLRLKTTDTAKEKLFSSKRPEAAKEIKQKASEVLLEPSVESLETQAGVEFANGKVSEIASEDKAQAPLGGASTYSADAIEAIRAKLLKALPPQEVMIKQIRKKLYREEKILTKRMNKLLKQSHKHAFQLTLVVAQLRKVREYFSMLAHATYELIKHLWLKIVHGV